MRQEILAASHKCHFCVRGFGRVFDSRTNCLGHSCLSPDHLDGVSFEDQEWQAGVCLCFPGAIWTLEMLAAC